MKYQDDDIGTFEGKKMTFGEFRKLPEKQNLHAMLVICSKLSQSPISAISLATSLQIKEYKDQLVTPTTLGTIKKIKELFFKGWKCPRTLHSK